MVTTESTAQATKKSIVVTYIDKQGKPHAGIIHNPGKSAKALIELMGLDFIQVYAKNVALTLEDAEKGWNALPEVKVPSDPTRKTVVGYTGARRYRLLTGKDVPAFAPAVGTTVSASVGGKNVIVTIGGYAESGEVSATSSSGESMTLPHDTVFKTITAHREAKAAAVSKDAATSEPITFKSGQAVEFQHADGSWWPATFEGYSTKGGKARVAEADGNKVVVTVDKVRAPKPVKAAKAEKVAKAAKAEKSAKPEKVAKAAKADANSGADDWHNDAPAEAKSLGEILDAYDDENLHEELLGLEKKRFNRLGRALSAVSKSRASATA